MKRPLTVLALKALKPKSSPYYVSDAKQDGLRVRVGQSGAMSWNVTWRVKGEKVRSISLGKVDVDNAEGLGLEAARARTAAIMRAARQGIDLLAQEAAEKDDAERRTSMAELVELYAASLRSPHRRGGALRTAEEIERRLLRALSEKLTTPVELISRGWISKELDRVAGTHPREAEKRRQVIHAMFRWGMSKGYASQNPLAGTPTYGAGETRDRALNEDEIRNFWRWLDAGADRMPTDVVAVIRLQILTGARVGELAGMDAGELEIDGKRLIWTLPPSRSKNKKLRVTPLAGRAKDIVLAALDLRPNGSLFRTMNEGRALTSSDMGQALLNRTLPIAHFTTHDLRRTVVSGMDELGISLDTIAAVVGHQRGTAATATLVRHYSRPKLDSRIEAALTAWQEHVEALLSGKKFAGNVVKLAG